MQKWLFLVTEFSRKTGDYGSLSLTDLKVLALTYMLEAQQVGTDHLSENPTIRATVEISKPYKFTASQEVDADGKKKEPAVQLVGFVHPKDDENDEEVEDEDTNSRVRDFDFVSRQDMLVMLW